ncbi:MAG: FMN-binding protein, partial [Ruminococcus sp.]|nr:FMN-binding protein [Ruminococcus sp.]
RGETTVAVSLKDGTIDNIMVMNTEDDTAYFKRAESLLKQVLQQQTTDLDAISGATFSSKGILEAIADALEQAKQANSGNQTTTVTTVPVETTTTTVATTKLTETTELTPSLYIDGEYIGSAVCYPDEDEDFLPYDLTVKVCIENDQITAITDVEGFGADYDSANDWYIDRALNGTKKISGIAAQILAAQTTDVDAVSGATCSSDAILTAVQDALQQALREG